MGPGILPETTVSKYNPPCHLQMPTKALSCKKKAICEHGPEAPLCTVGQGSFKIEPLRTLWLSYIFEGNVLKKMYKVMPFYARLPHKRGSFQRWIFVKYDSERGINTNASCANIRSRQSKRFIFCFQIIF